MSIEQVIYRASAEATGGRDGRAISSDGVLDIELTTPRETLHKSALCLITQP